MRIFLLPVSTRRALLYCERLPLPPAGQLGDGQQQAQQQEGLQASQRHQHPPSLLDKAQTRAANLWADWEKKPSGTWQHKVVSYSNIGFRRIAFEEWGLKSVPPLPSAQRKAAEAAVKAKTGGAKTEVKTEADATTPEAVFPPSPPAEVFYPPSLIPSDRVASLLHRLSTEREGLHRKRLFWSIVGMPITAPIAILPVIPNLPFFYLVYRAWSHWRAIAGGKHLQLLLQTDGLEFKPSPILDAIYAKDAKAVAVREAGTSVIITGGSKSSAGSAKVEEEGILSHDGGKAVAEAFDSPLLEEQLERAIWQVEKAKQGAEKKEENDEKKEQ